MVQKWQKFIQKHPLRSELEGIIKDIQYNHLEKYYIKPLKGYQNTFRIRKGKIRVVFEKIPSGNNIIAVDTRGGVYRGL